MPVLSESKYHVSFNLQYTEVQNVDKWTVVAG